MSRVQLLRAGEVAALYGVDESTVHGWERAGRLRSARRDPARWRWAEDNHRIVWVALVGGGASGRSPPRSGEGDRGVHESASDQGG